jgi:telomerase reverse transcriptase
MHNHFYISLDIFNILSPSYQRKREVRPTEPDPRKLAQDARHLAKYVFPRQYGLSSPFRTVFSRKEAFKIPNYSDREAEIKVSIFALRGQHF